MFPTDSNYVNRITEVLFGPSNRTGNPMVTVNMEVISPDEVEVGGTLYNIAGVPTKNYYTTQTDDEEKTANARKRLTDLLTILGLDTSALNWDNLGPQVQELKGKLVLTMMSSQPDTRRKTPTAAQIEAAKKQGLKDFSQIGDVMKNPVTGKPLINYWPRIDEIFGLAPDQTGGGKPY